MGAMTRVLVVARSMHAAATLSKPYDADELVRTIRILSPRRT